MSRPAGPICVKCSRVMRPMKNDVVVELLAEFGSYELWYADEWGCPVCDCRVITGYGSGPFAQHLEPNYEVIRERNARHIRVSVS